MIHIHIHRRPRPAHPQPQLLAEWDAVIAQLHALLIKGDMK